MFNNLNLERPIAFIDVETTGLNPQSDRIVELSVLKVNPDGNEEYKNHRINPGVPIPASATAIHGITDSDVAGEPTFGQFAKSLRDFLEGCDLGGFNLIRFDLPFLEAEFRRAEVEFSRLERFLIDSQTIYHLRDPRDLSAAYKKYCGKELVHSHNAEQDARAAAEVLDGQLAMYSDLPRNVSGLCALCYESKESYVDPDGKFIWMEDEAVCNFGKKHKGRKLRDIAVQDPAYLQWIARADFTAHVCEIATRALRGEFPKRN